MTTDGRLREAYEEILTAVCQLIEIDPPRETPEGQLLYELATAMEKYEKEKLGKTRQ